MGVLIHPGVEAKMKRSRRESIRQLMELAEAQQGFFTTLQARQVGFSGQAQSYHVKMGNWVREHRGIYRLAFYPMGDHPELMVWYLWSQDREGNSEGIYSHETALSLHNLSDLLPSRLHMTVPPTFTRKSVPKGLVLHRDQIDPEDVEHAHGVPITRPIMTILDLLKCDTVAWDLLRQALRQALNSGLIAKADLLEAADKPKGQEVLEQLYRLTVEVSNW
jgi:predicted transcriptional regulator of viral defense system